VHGELRAHPSAALTLHITDATGCTAVDPDTFTCSSIDVTGDNRVEQSIYVFATGVDSLEGIDFGVEYSPSVRLVAWVDCIRGGGTIASPTWPASGSSVARAFGRCESPRGPDDFILLGYFRVQAGSTGDFRVTGAARARGVASIVTCAYGYWRIGEPCGFGSVQVGGRRETPPYNPCGGCD
jgi:hypothetical protein